MSLNLTLHKLLQSFVYAGQGIPVAFKGRNMRVHGAATIVVVIAGFWLGITRFEWLIILLFVAAVWSLEMVNTALEELANTMRDTNHLNYRATKTARDVAAGAVLVMAIIAAISAGIIFLPYLFPPMMYGPPAY
ncbi:diacylglycerol kinase family protein [Candidatus Woesebacteria bacterium]|nr:diacylglycerol kinase family protein [Candidatus Woesebacteria bacterium]